MSAGARGYTLIEMLAAITIMGILAGLAMIAVQLIRTRQNEMRAVHELEQVEAAVTAYLGDYAMLGDPAGSATDVPDFARRPLTYLVDRPRAAGKEPYIDPPQARVADAEGHPLADRVGAVRLLDPFRAPFRWGIVNEPAGKERVTRAVGVLTRMGTPGRRNEIIVLWRNEDGRWHRFTGMDLKNAESKDAAARTREEADEVLVLKAFQGEFVLP